MKNRIAFILAVLLTVCLTGCGTTVDEPEQVITMAAREPEATSAAAEALSRDAYSFAAGDVTLTPGTPFDASRLGEPASVYEAPSCAVEGMDIIYQYEGFELTAVDNGRETLLYSVYLLDPNLSTPEGLSLGDSQESVLTLCGEPSSREDSVWTYTAGNTQLILLFSSGTVSSIEYRAVL